MVSILKIALLLFCLLPGLSQGAVILKGKITSKISGHVVKEDNLFVTDENGGWYDQELKMEQLGAFDSPYSVDAPLRITSTSGTFQVHLDAPLILQNQAKPELLFRDMTVKLGLIGERPLLLKVADNVMLTNPPASSDGEDSIGHYLLNISGYPPAGNFKSVTGTYSGVLSLTFEPVVK
ncbi:hypothetical protein LJN55_22030 [Erwinia rhapontici]|uniref:hypothetical protein n=1 Tax=Erwinia rhapontici TaxID=55212 RepID=UPI001D0D906C|nr:hypothetical protein [Erwinia rhapontici]UDQ80053.1 hypothetical protein LJN55_22030 [Erwinia rhapontici]